MQNIQAVFWDYDNTILETAQGHWEKHFVTLKKYGINLDEKYRQKIYHNNGSQNWQWINKELNLKIPEQQYLNEIDSYFQNKMTNLPYREGVEEAFKYFTKKKIPQAIVTNGRTASVKPILEGKGINKIMKFILYKEDYDGRKPEPTPYLTAIKKMEEIIGKKLNPKQCLAIEDDPKGVESAHKAGMTVIHRKLSQNQAPCKIADYIAFTKNDFLNVINYKT